MFDGDAINRCELFDESDLDLALARFDDLSAATPRSVNAATRTTEQFVRCFAANDWDALTEILAGTSPWMIAAAWWAPESGAAEMLKSRTCGHSTTLD